VETSSDIGYDPEAKALPFVPISLINFKKKQHQKTTQILSYHTILFPKSIYTTSTKTISHQFELAIRQYIAAFDGKNELSPAEFQAKFDAVYHQKFSFVPKDGKTPEDDGVHTSKATPLSRAEMFEKESAKYAAGTVMTLVHFRKIGLDCFDIAIMEGDTTVRVVTTISDKQAAITWEIPDGLSLKVLEASVKSAAFKFVEFGTYGANM
jgi:hypothetical protein